MAKNNPSERYFAQEDSENIGESLVVKVEEYDRHCEETGRTYLWNHLHRFRSANFYSGARVNQSGDHGEYAVVHDNHLGNILRHMHIQTTSQRPTFEAKASNTDARSQRQTVIANGVLDYLMRSERIERHLSTADQDAGAYAEGFISVTWDPNAGKVVDVETYVDDETGEEVTNEIHEGDVLFKNFTPNNVIRDCSLESYDDVKWLILRDYENKWELAAEYPEKEEEITNQDIPDKTSRTRLGDRLTNLETDQIPFYTFYHDRTKAVPEGRMVVFLYNGTVLFDGPLPFEGIPVYREVEEEHSGTPFAYTVAYDLAPLQMILDTLTSTIFTNQKTFGVQVILAPQGSITRKNELSEGITIIEYPMIGGTAMKPEPMNFTLTAPEVFTFRNDVIHDMETISGVNSVARGNPEASLRSGAALALVQSMAIQFSSGRQMGYVRLLEDVGTATVRLLKQYADHRRIMTIAGKANRSHMVAFDKSDLEEIDRVTVDIGNPLTRTTAGRLELATNLLQNGLIQTPDQYLMVIQTGQLDNVLEGQTAELLAIRDENERMAEGQPARVMATDMHAMHITEHKAVLASPEARENDQLAQITLAHIMEHIQMLQDLAANNPGLLLMTGQGDVLQAMMAMQPQQAPPGAPAGAPPSAPAAPSGAPSGDPAVPGMSAPTNPLTGNKWNPETGGL